MKIDDNYFNTYDGEGGSYDDNWKHFTGIRRMIDLIKRKGFPINSVNVLGTATGAILPIIENDLGCHRIYGCELWKPAYDKTPEKYKKHIVNMDMIEYVKTCKKADVIFSNSLFYLQEENIPTLLNDVTSKCEFFYFEGFFNEKDAKEVVDPYRTITKDYHWWADHFRQAGFIRTTSKYLWRKNGVTGKMR